MLETDQVSQLLAELQRRQHAKAQRQAKRDKVTPEQSLHRAMQAKRKKLNSLVSSYAPLHERRHSHNTPNCGGVTVGHRSVARPANSWTGELR